METDRPDPAAGPVEKLQAAVRALAAETATPRLSAVVPCFNEEASLPALVARLGAACRAAVGDAYEIVLVDDGSRDGTFAAIRAAAEADRRIVGLSLSRNFGHQQALTAGLQFARGDLVFVIDADLQDPPEELPAMLATLEAGADVVYGRRLAREGESWFKTATASAFYRLLSRLANVSVPRDTGDFRLMNRKVADALMAMPEQHRFIRGMVAWLGFRQVEHPYIRQSRTAGATGYSLRKMVRLALDALTGFSIAPLRLASLAGGLAALFAGGITAYALVSWLMLAAVPGWASTVILISFFSAVQLLTIGIVGEYVGRIFLEVKRRPHFLIAEVVGAPRADAARPTMPAPSAPPHVRVA